MNKNLKLTNALISGAIVTIIFVVIITIFADLYLPLKDLLKQYFWHHWVAKGILSVIIFLFSACVKYTFSKETLEKELSTGLNSLTLISICSTIILLMFFFYETFY